jgi:hypothetical protein
MSIWSGAKLSTLRQQISRGWRNTRRTHQFFDDFPLDQSKDFDATEDSRVAEYTHHNAPQAWLSRMDYNMILSDT